MLQNHRVLIELLEVWLGSFAVIRALLVTACKDNLIVGVGVLAEILDRPQSLGWLLCGPIALLLPPTYALRVAG